MNMLQKVKKIICFTGILTAVFAVQSCLKNSAYYIPFSSAAASVDLPLAASTGNGITAFAYPPSVTSVTLPVYFNVASPSLPSAPVTGTLTLDTAGLSAYNAANGTAYQPLPTTSYTVSKWDVTVPAGKRLDSITVTVDLSSLDLSQAYVFPVTIASASLPIEQWNHVFYYIAVKNQWDGIYSYQGYSLRAGDPVLTGNFSGQQMTLLTSGSNSVTFATVALWGDGATGISIGNPQLTIASNNSVTITSPGGAYNNPGYNSIYDPNTQTFFISFTWGAGPSARLSTDTLTYQGPR